MPAVFRRYLAVVALFTLGNSSNLFLHLRARELGVPDAQVPLLWAAVSPFAAFAVSATCALTAALLRVVWVETRVPAEA